MELSDNSYPEAPPGAAQSWTSDLGTQRHIDAGKHLEQWAQSREFPFAASL